MKKPLKIAYILLRFPHLTETFVAEEIREVLQQGVEVQLFSLLPPRPGPVHPTSQTLAQQTYYVPHVYSLALWWAQIYFMFTAPRRYCKLLWNLMTQPTPRFIWLFKRLAIFLKGIYLARHLQDSEVQLIHAHFASLSGAGAMVASQMLGLPLTVTTHAGDIYSLENDLLRMIGEAADRLITISDYNKQVIGEMCPQLSQERIVVIHCGIDLDLFQTTVAVPDDDTFHILSVGSLVEKKGHEYLIRACRQLKDQELNFHCDIVGHGGLQVELEQLIIDLDVDNEVTLAGAQKQSQILKTLQSSHVFTLACVVAKNGDRDGIPVAMMEALAMGVPVVSTQVSGIPELVHHQETGLLASEKDVDALAKALARLATDDTLRQQLASKGRALVVRDFNIRKNVRQLVNLFHQAVQDVNSQSSYSSKPKR